MKGTQPWQLIDLTIEKDRRLKAIQRVRERNIIIPTFAQMKDPGLISQKVKVELSNIGLWDSTRATSSEFPGKISRYPTAVLMLASTTLSYRPT